MAPIRIRFGTAQTRVAQAGVGFAAVLGLLGLFIDFYPGAELGWYGVGAAFALAGFLSRTRKLRLVALILAVLLATFAWGGYLRGRQYRRWLDPESGIVGSPSPQAR